MFLDNFIVKCEQIFDQLTVSNFAPPTHNQALIICCTFIVKGNLGLRSSLL